MTTNMQSEYARRQNASMSRRGTNRGMSSNMNSITGARESSRLGAQNTSRVRDRPNQRFLNMEEAAKRRLGKDKLSNDDYKNIENQMNAMGKRRKRRRTKRTMKK